MSEREPKKKRYMCHICWNYKPCVCTLGWDYEMWETIGATQNG